MSFNWISKATTILLSSVLLGGVVTTTIPTLTITAQAENLEEAPISYQTFKADEKAAKKAVKQASPAVKRQINGAFFKRMEKKPVNAYGATMSAYFTQIMQSLASHAVSELGRKGQVTSAFKKDYRAMLVLYNQFRGRLEPMYQDVLSEYPDTADQQISKNKVDSEVISDFGDYFEQYFNADIRPHKVTGVPRVKSKITKLAAKKTASKKYVKVKGTVKLSKKANYAKIKTYKGTRYAKLKAHKFSKKIYAPKAKRVSATVGHYVHGHFSRVTATKSVHVK
ncbi:hypothetical protein [Levilactobacillus angrenensis]|uniref:Surface layer protein A domain-containing protein n=1 Tax=Levilactobacillus angrenensis TaxID=2486020 RepID=A0ABW1UA20_9LACO|nr:hypothetical protein [Levilactobacillus angrenensis]